MSKEEILAEPNTEAVNFRIPKSMKNDIKMLCEYGQYASQGELFRTLLRKHREETINSQGYKYWLKRKEQEKTKPFTLENLPA